MPSVFAFQIEWFQFNMLQAHLLAIQKILGLFLKLSLLICLTRVGNCCCSPSASEFDVLCVQRWYSAYLGCNEWLFELLLPFYHL